MTENKSMVLIKLSKDYKIGSYFYREFDTLWYDPQTLLRILKQIPDEELAAKKLLCDAICFGDYKKNKGVTYLIPPVKVDGEVITHINIKKSSTNLLQLILSIYESDHVENSITILLNNVICKRRKEEVENERKRYEEMIIPLPLPIKKRKVV